MNKRGHKSNLEPSHPNNRNAMKSGAYSPRRREEEAEKIRELLEENTVGYLVADELAMYADLRAYSKILAQDIAERGVSDKNGKPRRQAGAYFRTMNRCLELGEKIRGVARADEVADDDTPWNEAEAVILLAAIARDPGEPATARIAAMKVLHQVAPAAEVSHDREFYEGLLQLSDEELDAELEALSIPVTTGERRGPRPLNEGGSTTARSRPLKRSSENSEIYYKWGGGVSR